ncbi:hypothetical protein AAU61_13175 [Desulfocarbo indianensis]|nr:hypothetical protein AAU61_13175 [Desulfocarbo indianensis]
MSAGGNIHIGRLVIEGRRLGQAEGRRLAQGLARELANGEGASKGHSRERLRIELTVPGQIGIEALAKLMADELRGKL